MIDPTRLHITADQHFDHWTSEERNIIRYCNRPFYSIQNMNEGLIARWNEVVGPDHWTILAGDVTLGPLDRFEYFVSRLNGHLLILLGNHDDKWWRKGLKRLSQRYWPVTQSGHRVEVLRKHFILVPVEVEGHKLKLAIGHWFDPNHPGHLHLFGHAHGNSGHFRLENQALDVGVDCWNYYPPTLQEILDKVPDWRSYQQRLDLLSENTYRDWRILM